MRKIGIGVIGCGNISDVYIRNLSKKFCETYVAALTDIDLQRAEEKAELYGIKTVCLSVDELLELDEVELVLILTQPDSHYVLAKQSLLAGKHTYTEKPFSYTRNEGLELLRLAEENKVHLGAAPDTILGAGIQTGRKLIEDGWIGEIVGANISASFVPPETWHPNPEFLYKKGAGPLYDNGPYLFAALASVMGTMKDVICSARMTHKRRLITSSPRFGTWIDVEVPTFLKGVVTFESGAIASVLLSTDSRNSKEQEAGFEVYGTLGTIVIGNPCSFSGAISYKKNGSEEWADIPLLYDYTDDSRGIGAADMAHAVLHGTEPRLNEEFIAHVMDALIAMDEAWQSGSRIEIKSGCKKPAPLELGLNTGETDRGTL